MVRDRSPNRPRVDHCGVDNYDLLCGSCGLSMCRRQTVRDRGESFV
jgi:hypothetical protein